MVRVKFAFTEFCGFVECLAVVAGGVVFVFTLDVAAGRAVAGGTVAVETESVVGVLFANAEFWVFEAHILSSL